MSRPKDRGILPGLFYALLSAPGAAPAGLLVSRREAEAQRGKGQYLCKVVVKPFRLGDLTKAEQEEMLNLPAAAEVYPLPVIDGSQIYIILRGFVRDMRCFGCDEVRSASDFIKPAYPNSGRLLRISCMCQHCDPPKPLPKKLSGRVFQETSDITGRRFYWLQRTRSGTFGEWQALSEMELREVKPGEFRPQPKKVRHEVKQ